MAAPKSWAKVAWGRACRVVCPPDMPARAVWACTVGSGHGNLARGDLEAGGYLPAWVLSRIGTSVKARR